MGIIGRHINHLESIKNDLEDVGVNVVKENIDAILWVLQENQLGKGIGSDGSIVGKYKQTTEDWANDPYTYPPRKPKEKGQPYNFEWTGGLFDEMYVKSEKDSYSIFSRDGKTRMLEQTYGKLLKLTEENNKHINKNIIEPELYKYVLNNFFKFN